MTVLRPESRRRLPEHFRRGLTRLYLAVSLPWVAWFGFQIYDIAQRSRYISHTREMSHALWSMLIVPIGGPVLFLLIVWALAGFRKSVPNKSDVRKMIEGQSLAAPAPHGSQSQHHTNELKADLARLRAKFASDILYRPDIAADQFFRTGILYGEQSLDWPKLNEAKLTEQQKEALPRDYYTKGGVNPDDVAGIFAYHSGDAMIEVLAMLEKGRRESNLSPKEYLDKIVDEEIIRQMQRRG